MKTTTRNYLVSRINDQVSLALDAVCYGGRRNHNSLPKYPTHEQFVVAYNVYEPGGTNELEEWLNAQPGYLTTQAKLRELSDKVKEIHVALGADVTSKGKNWYVSVINLYNMNPKSKLYKGYKRHIKKLTDAKKKKRDAILALRLSTVDDLYLKDDDEAASVLAAFPAMLAKLVK